MKEEIEDLKRQLKDLKKELNVINSRISNNKDQDKLNELKEQQEMIRMDIYDVELDIEYLERNLESNL